jgi:homopolymeric O-antigen transport system ATP-binding protein
MSIPAIRVDGLWKEYRIGKRERAPESFREALIRTLSRTFREFAPKEASARQASWFWALQDVSFTVEPGEIVGVIGRNGAGKTTILKVLSRITRPNRGRAEVLGRLGSLLEVGTGFHPELTGRENIYINGSILGMRRAEIRRRFDEIVAFAEVEQFLDTPVKRYSTGMAVRLAFSIAAHLEAEILLIDEVLAVGDMRFQRKCLGKMGEVSRDGRTVLFVSHNLGAISKLCTRGLVLNEGKLVAATDIAEAVRTYTEQVSGAWKPSAFDFMGPLGGTVEFDEISINECSTDGAQVMPSEPVLIRVRGEAKKSVEGYRTTFSIFKDGELVVSRHDTMEPSQLGQGRFESEVAIPAYFLSPGEYWVTFGGYTVETGAWTWSRTHLRFVVVEEWSKQYDTTAKMGLVNLPEPGRRIQLDET